jgi:HAD superfamily hydrolase (TIGR01490 family)
MNRLTLFDLDHTLLPIDSDYAWGEFTLRLGWVDPVHFKKKNDQFYADYQRGALDIHEYVEFATQAIRQKGLAQAQQAHAQFMSEVIEPEIKAQARQLIKTHQERGDHVMIVTATNEFVTGPIAKALGVEDLIAVELERDETGWINGRIKGIPSMREGKVARLKQWFAERGDKWVNTDITFYSDSTNDLPLLSAVNHPIATNPDEKLRAWALEKGWPILDLFPPV